MKRKILSLLVIVMTAAVLFCSCAKSESFVDNSFGYDMIAPGDAAEEDFEYSSDSSTELLDKTTAETPTDRKIIMKYNFSVETKDLDSAVKALEEAVSSYGGYYESANVSGNTEDGGWAELVLRIPSSQTAKFNEGISELGNITNQNKSGQDVTTAYYDTENQLSSLKIQQERLMALLEKAESLDDILKLETELTRVRTEIERLTTLLVKYDNLIDYTTVTVELRQVRTYTEPEPETFGTKIAEAFKSSLEFTKELFEGAVIAVVYLSPLLVFAAVVLVVVLVIVKSKKKKKAKKSEVEKAE
ncbi:MAG: DUF4349 domain-containing protein [Ruminococcaceae bacterium]|nr:DUF4349 domain-containing protein [Oscillospiraceae bacterium]